jgi:hypothetical protein
VEFRKHLKKLSIHYSLIYDDFPSSEDIPINSFINAAERHLSLCTAGSHGRFILHTPVEMSTSIIQTLTYAEFVEKLKYCELVADFRISHTTFQFFTDSLFAWRNIPGISLWNTHNCSLSFPVFMGKEISLNSFSLLSWNHPTILPNLMLARFLRRFNSFPGSTCIGASVTLTL